MAGPRLAPVHSSNPEPGRPLVGSAFISLLSQSSDSADSLKFAQIPADSEDNRRLEAAQIAAGVRPLAPVSANQFRQLCSFDTPTPSCRAAKMNAIMRRAIIHFCGLLLAITAGGCASLPNAAAPAEPIPTAASEPQVRAASAYLQQPPLVEKEPAKLPEGGSTGSLEPRVDLEKERPEEEEKLKKTVELRGRIHADAIFANQSPTDKALIGDLQNAVGFRRARLGAQGTVGEQMRWVSEFEFAGGEIAFKDV